MTVPTYRNSAIRIITLAMIDAGILAEGDSPNSDQLARNIGRLNDLINLWQTQGLKLWLQEDTSVTLTAGTSLYSFGPSGTTVMAKPLRVTDAYYSDSNGIRRPVGLISRQEYNSLSQVTQTGEIVSVFVDKQIPNLVVRTWQVPDATAATGTLHLILQQQATNFVSITDDMDFPQEWALALRWGLADEISTGKPQVIMDRCTQRAQKFFDALEAWDVEDADTRFQPDPQYAVRRRFR